MNTNFKAKCLVIRCQCQYSNVSKVAVAVDFFAKKSAFFSLVLTIHHNGCTVLFVITLNILYWKIKWRDVD